ncbi:SusC/RagA family TonB-linked outer membrane protein [Chitinophaga sp.]|uniref:SusC/RagA family TonB-linked outer membrane protein n=1 Tax=Chitinophaga sp. TaxID=1869181 RepID=UPI0031D99FF5
MIPLVKWGKLTSIQFYACIFHKNQLFSVMCVPTPYGTIVARILLCVLLINTLAFQRVSAHQQYGKQKVTIVANDISLDNVLKQIEKQTGLRFMYAIGAFNMNEKVKASFQQTMLDDVLSSLLGVKGIVWQYRDGTILLKHNVGKGGDIIPGETPKGDGIINGKILDANDAPIPGATILIKGTKRGTKTNVDGSFKLDNVEPGAVLLITSIGYETKEVVVKEEELVFVKMKTAIGALDEAIVIAYGKTSGRMLTGNVSTIKAEDIEHSPVSNPLLALTGRVPGLNINQKTGYSNSGVVTAVQGQNSILRGNDPFYVIDGVPYPSQGLSITGNVQGVGGVNTLAKGSTINFINPSDIESITILKDADATAIYGSRAANGAILITTKKGKAGKSKVNVDYSQGIGKVARYLDLMNTPQYLEMRHEAIVNDKGTVKSTDYDINGFWDTTRNTNWQKELIGKSAQYMNLNGSVSGGNNNIQYLVGGTFHRETSVIPGNFTDQKGSAHFSITSNTDNNKFQLQFSGSYLFDNNQLPTSDLASYASYLAPDAPPLYNADGTLNFMLNAAGASTFKNPLADLNNKFDTKTKNLISNLALTYNILPGLNIKSSFGYTDMNTDEVVQVPLSSYAPDAQPFATRVGYYGKYNINTWIVEPQISYNHALGNGKLDVLLGSSIQRNNSTGNQIMGVGYNTDQAIKDMNSAASLTSSGAVASVYKYSGVFGRINYIYNNKYIVNLSARRDGSSRFGPANRFQNFGAVGIGWVFSAENFLRDYFPTLSYGKLRFSYGTTGNDQIGDYQFLNLYYPVIVEVPYRGIIGLESNGIYNPYLQWELTKKTNVGLDLGFIRDRVILNANYYINRSSNQLMPYALPSITGVTSITTNYPATVQNSGWEFTLSGNVIQNKKFNWNANFNLTIPRNKLIRFDNLASSSYASLLIVGQSINITKIYTYAGVNSETGKYQFRNSKGELTSTPNFATDKYNYVITSPNWYAGFSNSFSYQGFSLDFLFQFMKRKGQNYFTGSTYPGSFNRNQPTSVLDRWRKAGDDAPHQRFNANNSLAGAYSNATASTISYRDASYCRLKNISLSWQLPQQWLRSANITNVKVYTQAQNLLTFTGYKGLDPESLKSTTLPPLKTFVFGLQVGF